MEELILKLFEKSVVGKNKKELPKYLNSNCFIEDSNGSIKIRNNNTEELIFVASYSRENVITNIQ